MERTNEKRLLLSRAKCSGRTKRKRYQETTTAGMKLGYGEPALWGSRRDGGFRFGFGEGKRAK